MAEPGDPKAPAAPGDHDLDDAVGFASPASLAGRPRAPEPAPEPPTAPQPVAEPSLFDAPEPAPPPEPQPQPEPVAPWPAPAPPPVDTTPAWARETPAAQTYAGFGARREIPAELEGASGLYTVYALILFAVPTLGVSALIALLAVTGRPGPSGEIAASHFVFQQRTLWAGAVVALAGAILIVVGLGVFVLFLLALWLIVRGAAGVLKLKAGRPMPNPRGWLI
jgi:uncharacterized membrane protein